MGLARYYERVMRRLDHERLRVYRVSLDFLTHAHALIADFPRGHSSLADQLSRAASSVCLNIAEGAGEFSALEKARFYRIARRSATECAAILDVCAVLRLHAEDRLATGRALLVEVVSILTALVNRNRGSGQRSSE